MAEFAYNGIVMELVKTRMIGREPIRSPDGTDIMYVKHTFDIDAVYNPEATSYGFGEDGEAVQQPGFLPVTTDAAIRQQLMSPRQQLIYAVNDTILLESPYPGSTTDAWVGPMPISCNVREIIGTKTFLISYRIETWVNECQSADSSSRDPIVSSRYQVNHSVDRQRLTTITSTGVTVFRMDGLESAAQGADHYRNKCLPPKPDGFQRQAIDIKVTPDGSKLLWQVVNKEMIVFLGDKQLNKYGVEWFEAVYTQRANPPESGDNDRQSIFVTGIFNCRVVGNKDALKLNLITFAVALAVQRCAIKAGPVIGSDPLIRQVSVSEVVHDRMIDFELVTLYPPPRKPQPIGLAGIRDEFIGIDILDLITVGDANLDMPNDGNTRGTFVGEAMAAALKAACVVVNEPDPDQPSSPGSSIVPLSTYVSPIVTTTVVDDLESQASHYSDATANEGVYTQYNVTATYQRNWGMIACPVAAPTMPSSSSSGGSGGSPPDGLGGLNGPPTYMAPEVLTLCSPMTKVRFAWVVERNGTKPKIPDKDLTSKNLTLLNDMVMVAEVYLAPDGQTKIFRVEGAYEYVQNTAEDGTATIPFPQIPWSDFQWGDDTIEADDFIHGIIDSPDDSTGDGGGGTPPTGLPGKVI